MESKVAAAIRKAFRIALADAAPDFHPAYGETVEPHCDLYRWEADPTLTCYLYLQPDLLLDRFGVDAACTPENHFPGRSATGLSVGGQVRFPISRLWAPSEPAVGWSLRNGNASPTEAELLRAVPFQVAECIRQIRKHVIPWFRRKLRERIPPAGAVGGSSVDIPFTAKS